MCGRYALLLRWKDLHRLMRLSTEAEPQLPLRYNIAPTQDAPVVRRGEAGNELVTMRWGLVLSLAGGPAKPCINARSETAATSPAFRGAVRDRRCIVPASGFYEWMESSRAKRPHYITAAAGGPLLMAGIWERSERNEAGGSFAVLTRGSAGAVKPVHERMPVVLREEDAQRWLDSGLTVEQAAAMWSAQPPELAASEVSTRVNSAANDDAACLAPPARPAAGLWDQPEL